MIPVESNSIRATTTQSAALPTSVESLPPAPPIINGGSSLETHTDAKKEGTGLFATCKWCVSKFFSVIWRSSCMFYTLLTAPLRWAGIMKVAKLSWAEEKKKIEGEFSTLSHLEKLKFFTKPHDGWNQTDGEQFFNSLFRDKQNSSILEDFKNFMGVKSSDDGFIKKLHDAFCDKNPNPELSELKEQYEAFLFLFPRYAIEFAEEGLKGSQSSRRFHGLKRLGDVRECLEMDRLGPAHLEKEPAAEKAATLEAFKNVYNQLSDEEKIKVLRCAYQASDAYDAHLFQLIIDNRASEEVAEKLKELTGEESTEENILNCLQEADRANRVLIFNETFNASADLQARAVKEFSDIFLNQTISHQIEVMCYAISEEKNIRLERLDIAANSEEQDKVERANRLILRYDAPSTFAIMKEFNAIWVSAREEEMKAKENDNELDLWHEARTDFDKEIIDLTEFFQKDYKGNFIGFKKERSELVDAVKRKNIFAVPAYREAVKKVLKEI